MGLFDWLIVLIPLSFVMYMGYYSRRYIVQVSDFLSAGRCCRRYIISAANIAQGLSILTLVAFVEVHFKTGFALGFWNSIILPLSVMLGLIGFCLYRFRETKAMSFGQLLEMRYSRGLRIFSAALRSLSEMLANMIMPAIAARFFIYFLDLPATFRICGLEISTFRFIIVLTLTLAIALICFGGMLSLVITDSIQGIICYPLMAVFVILILMKFSWGDEIVPVMMDRSKNESFLNPYEISELRDFNLFFLGVSCFQMVLHYGSWITCSSSAAKSPHEQKMAGLLGTFRGSLNSLLYVLIAIALLTMMNHSNWADDAKIVRDDISVRVAKDIVDDEAVREKLITTLRAIPPQRHEIGVDPPLSDKRNLDTTYFEAAHKSLNENIDDQALSNLVFQKFKTLFHQTILASGMRQMLPGGLLGLFCLLMVLAMLSTDDSRIFSASMTVTQDVIMPLVKRKITPRQQIRIIQAVSIGVGVFFYFGSSYMSQLDYINLFVTSMTNLWMGGCGPMVIFGLYSRFGTTAGAWTSLLTGVFMSTGYIAVKQYWTHIHQFLQDHGMADAAGRALEFCSKPFEPYVVWRMSAIKCPVNSYEFYLITMLVTLFLYIVVSLLTCKQPYNLDRMLPRGKYNIDGENKAQSKWSWHTFFSKIIGITPEFSKGDKFIAWSIFGYSIVYKFFFAFIVVVIWNRLAYWPTEGWSWYFLITSLIVPSIISVIVAIWFGIGSFFDFRHLFHDLKLRVINLLDNGAVEGNMSLADKEQLEKLDEPPTEP